MNQSYPVHNRTLQTETEANAVTQHTVSLFNLKPQSHRKPSIHSKLRWGQLIHLIFVVRFCSKVDQRLGKKMIHSCFDLRVDVFTRLWPNDKGQQCRVRADIQQRGNTQSKQSVGFTTVSKTRCSQPFFHDSVCSNWEFTGVKGTFFKTLA